MNFEQWLLKNNAEFESIFYTTGREAYRVVVKKGDRRFLVTIDVTTNEVLGFTGYYPKDIKEEIKK
jgi:hypothetical protein